ncbi:uncharacterized protein LOC131941737 [Physella acuta]|uniref:uncharacterized protein LOC131941737 n=1 Tax=Physella acuta TaxID=109671 RepID=UPI0027DD9767|nr:uncharacterized protein LOC131941737 [Physella acuta]
MNRNESKSVYVTTQPGLQNSAVSSMIADVPSDVMHYVHISLGCVLLPALGLTGVVMNTLVTVVMWRHGLEESTQILILTLALSDLFFSATRLIEHAENILEQLDIVSMYTLGTFYTTYLKPLTNFSIATSANIVAIMSVERLIAVWFPFKASRLITNFRTILAIISTLLFLFPWYALDIWSYDIKWYFIRDYHRPMAVYYFSKFYLEHSNMYSILNSIRNSVFVMIIPPGSIIVSSIMITIKLSRSSILVRHISSNAYVKRSKDLKVVKMALALCFSVVSLRIIPTYMVAFIYYSTVLQKILPANVVALIAYAQQVFFQASASANLVVYVSMSPKFAKTLKTFS